MIIFLIYYKDIQGTAHQIEKKKQIWETKLIQKKYNPSRKQYAVDFLNFANNEDTKTKCKKEIGTNLQKQKTVQKCSQQ